jgi:hypothetical protein
MNTDSNSMMPRAIQAWRQEDRELESRVDQVRDWMREVSQFGIPYFGEAATRLRPLRAKLEEHFALETELLLLLGDSYPSSSPEVEAVRRQSEHDHDLLLERIDDLVSRLEQVEPPFRSWLEAMDEVDLFVDVLEQHEEQELESLSMLIPDEVQRAL